MVRLSTVSRTVCARRLTGDTGSGLDGGRVHGEAVRGGVGAGAVAVQRLHAPARLLDPPVTEAQRGARPPGQEPHARPPHDLEHGEREARSWAIGRKRQYLKPLRRRKNRTDDVGMIPLTYL